MNFKKEGTKKMPVNIASHDSQLFLNRLFLFKNRHFDERMIVHHR